MKHIIDIFAETARQYPDRTAVVDCDGQLTYRELDERSNMLAHQLHAKTVLIMLPRRSNFLVAAFGTLKIGGCYIVVAADYPADRISYITQTSRAGALITTKDIWEQRRTDMAGLFAEDKEVVLVDQLGNGDISPVNNATWEQDAFMLFTSGTTGKPKGVVHTIRSLTRIMQTFAQWDAKRSEPVRDAVLADLGFAASLVGLFAPCFTGGTVYIIDEKTRMDMNSMADYINGHRIDRMFMGSSLGVSMLKQYDLHLSQLLLGGEKVTGVTPEMASRIDIIDYYGASEGFPVAMHHITGHEEVIPVGKPCDGDMVYILNQKMQPMPQGQMGEIYFGSERIAKCYWNLPELSAERFLDDPFRPGMKMLRIGDLGYIDENGELIHCGRADNMFKIHGQRVEPGEVENVAQQFSGMGDCVCCKKEVNGDEVICLFFESSQTIDTERLQTFMARQLPHYMMPTYFIPLDELPRNARGKIDRKSMPEPVRKSEMLMIAPATDREQKLFDIATELLGTKEFGVTDDLFGMGMTSIKAMKMAAEAERRGLLVKATDIIHLKTIRKVLQNQMTIMSWFSTYDPSRPTMVFTHGISITSDVQEKLKLFNHQYNVFAIEPIHEHYRYVFENESLEEVIAFYYDLMEFYLPANVQIAAFAGASYGGKLAYLMACKHFEKTGMKAAVIMGDTLLGIGEKLGQIYMAGQLEEFEKSVNNRIEDHMRERMITTFKLDFYGERMPEYDGKVVILHSTIVVKPGYDNLALWRQHASNLNVIPLSYTHNEICVDNPETLPYWEKAIAMITS